MHESKAESFRLLVKGASKHWLVLAAGPTVSVLSWLFWLFGIQALPTLYVITALGVSIAVPLFLSFHDVRVERDQLKGRLLPVFELSDGGHASYHSGENEAQGRFQTRKVIVRNISNASIDGVKARLVNLEPDDDGLNQVMPLLLRPLNMNSIASDYGFSLAPGESLPVGVFGVNSKTSDFVLYTVSEDLHSIRGLEGDSYRVRIEVVGRDVSPVTRTARIGSDIHRNPILTLL